AGPGADLGWNPAQAEDDERRLSRAALLRALVLVARDPAEIARATERFREHLQHPLALDPNLLDIVVAAAAREADEKRFEELREKADSPMILRRLVEALGNLPERRHLEEVEKFLVAHELPPAKQAVAQTLERLRADVALRERLVPELAAFLRGPRS